MQDDNHLATEFQLSGAWLGKDEKYVGSPMVSYRIGADGTVHDVKLKRSTGSKILDKSTVEYVRRWKYKPMPGCEEIEATMGILIHFR